MFLCGQQHHKESSPQKQNTAQQRLTFQDEKLSVRKPTEEVIYFILSNLLSHYFSA